MEEFFEAFSIKKVRECELRDECFLGFAHTCDKCDIYGQAYEKYPPITSDIILQLEEIIVNKWHPLTRGRGIYLSTGRFPDYVQKATFPFLSKQWCELAFFYYFLLLKVRTLQ